MLHNPKWEVKADPFSLDSLIAWLETRLPDEEYNFWCTQCMLGRYFTAHGFDVQAVGTGTITINGAVHHELRALPPHFNRIAIAEPRTYGAALERARKVMGNVDG